MFRPLILLLALASPAFAQLDPEKGLASMKAGDGLQVELFASEPMVINPTSMDIDPLGRVWIAEAVNYRCKLRNKPFNRAEGDRIQVLIDTNGDGKADEAKTFYQGKELYGPLSVCVIPVKNPTPQPPPRNGEGEKEKAPPRFGEGLGWGLRVLVAQSPDILEFTCKDAANPVADGPPKKFLTGFGGFDHDHGVHGLHLGPDGKLYFTVGDSGVTGLQSSDGKGKVWKSNTTDVQKGTVWRCDLDGKNLELIAHNFRNNYEACVDSFGEIWLSDNDDDGNQQTRICFVMPGGNYGYGPRGPGQSHWHEEQPGIVHKTLRTGFGSPTGIQFYEGSLLPKPYHNTLMHCDAGPREVRAFTRKPKGAGYELDKANMLTSSDTWFRPSDVCTAPDGSVFVCDWYDPGVGGHGMGDWTRGRVYRITPTGHKGYKVPEVKLDSMAGIVETMANPCRSTSMMGYQSGCAANDIEFMRATGQFVISENPFVQIVVAPRTLWVSAGPHVTSTNRFENLIEGTIFEMPVSYRRSLYPKMADRYVTLAKAAPKIPRGIEHYPDARRDWALLLRNFPGEDIKEQFYILAKFYDGQDIFYRAALNIACGTDPVRRDAILADFEKHFPEWNDKVADLVWELRPKSMLPKMEKLLVDAKLTPAQKARIVDILAASDDASAGKTVLGLLAGDYPAEVKAKAVENLKLFLPTKWTALAKGNELKSAIDKLLNDPKATAVGLMLAAAANDVSSVRMIDKQISNNDSQPLELRIQAVRTMGQLKCADSVDALINLGQPQGPLTIECIKALGQLLPSGQNPPAYAQKAFDALKQAVEMEKPSAEVKQAAIAALAGSRTGTGWLLQAAEKKQLSPDLMAFTGRLLRNSPFQGERNKALQIFPAPGKLDPKKLPAFGELAKRTGNADHGKAILAASLKAETQCLKCHVVNGTGGKIGPDLSAIGKKGSKEDLYNSLLVPSKAIADQFLSWKVDTDDGLSIVGLLVGETETEMTIRDANGKDYKFPIKGTERKKQLVSLMPEGLLNTLTEDELVDLVEYLFTLRTEVLGTIPGK
jgi:putative membrane-bound dehydrogenase-like protein